LDEKEINYQFFDTARFDLHNCKHASFHLQFILSSFIDLVYVYCYTYCPIRDTQQCSGEAIYWAPEDY